MTRFQHNALDSSYSNYSIATKAASLSGHAFMHKPNCIVNSMVVKSKKTTPSSHVLTPNDVLSFCFVRERYHPNIRHSDHDTFSTQRTWQLVQQVQHRDQGARLSGIAITHKPNCIVNSMLVASRKRVPPSHVKPITIMHSEGRVPAG